jgi:ATP-dependent Clp protease ATP-binding subunit ClpC
MFERFTERARRVLFFARYEVSERGGMSIETEHLLLGLVREGNGISARLLTTPPVSAEAIRAEVERRSPLRKPVAESVEIPFSEQCRRVLEYSAEEADRLRHSYVGPEHMLIGLLREEGSVAATILRELGLEPETVRGMVVKMSGDALPSGAQPHSFGEVIDRIKALVEHLDLAAEPEARGQLASLILRELEDLRNRFQP